MNPMLRTGLTHLGTAAGAGVATALFLATKSVDLYAIIDQVNVVVADVGKLVALATPIATGAYAVYKATTKSKLADLEQDPRIKGVVATPALAAELGPKVAPSVAELPVAAQRAA